MSERPQSVVPASPAVDDFSTSQAVLGWIQDIAPYGVFTTDRELRIRSWNNWLAMRSGMPADRVLGRLLVEVFPDLESRRLIGHFTRALAGEVSVLSTALHQHLVPLPRHHRSADSGLMLQTARIAPVRLDNRVTGTISMIEDVTQRETQAVSLQRQQEIDRLLSAALGALLQSNDPTREVAGIFPTLGPALGLDCYLGYVLDADKLALRLNSSVGVSPRQRESLGLLMVAEEDRDRHDDTPLAQTLGAFRAALSALGLQAHCCFPLAIGARVIGLVSFGSYDRAPISEGNLNVLSQISRYVAIALDRTLREREAVAASRAKDDFLAALSHELRTPLNPVLLIASEARENPDYPASAREAFRMIEKNALLEARLIDDLLDLTRIEHGKMRLEFGPLDAHAAVQDALETIRGEADTKRLRLTIDLAAPLCRVTGDGARLQQVFWNVLKNAVKFTPEEGTIHVQSHTEAAHWALTISDDGIGMTDKELQSVFAAFVQGEHAELGRGHRFGGLGLGLAISRKLIELHSGSIEAQSRGKGQGASFTITLPLAVARPAAGLGLAPGAVAIPGGSGYLCKGRILLVEDHEPTRTPLTRLLGQRGFDVVAVSSAAEALAAAESYRFDLVLSDIGLPDSDGYLVMRKLRDRYGLRGLALSGFGMDADVSRSAAAGFVAHLTKPISVAVLDRALGTALAAPGDGEDPARAEPVS